MTVENARQSEGATFTEARVEARIPSAGVEEESTLLGAGGMTSNLSIEAILAESERESERYAWEGSFADYLRMVIQKPAVSRLSHALVYDAVMAKGVETAPDGESVYGLFGDEMFGLEAALDRVVQYFASASQRLEVRKRILLLLGPPASGKSSLVALIKGALEDYTRTDAGAVYAIQGCPMQEEPLHLIPARLRSSLYEEYGVYVEGDLCPRCRYVLRTEYLGKVAEMPVRRFTFSEQEAIGIGYYIATNPNPMDSSLLVGSVDSSQLEGDRLEVAGKAFRLDGEFNVANRGMIELVEMFKADKHLLTTLLGLAQEQVIKMERFGSIYADEAIIGHSNEGDFTTFVSDEHSEALKDRIIAVQIPYNLKVSEEVKIYEKMLKGSSLHDVHTAPLTLPTMSVFAVLSRLEPPPRQGMSLIEKLRLHDGQRLPNYSRDDLVEIKRHQPNEGMEGVSPRYVMNRLGAVASQPGITCVSPLAVIDSLWQGLRENVSLDQTDVAKFVVFVAETVKEYNNLAIKEIQRAFAESFEQNAEMLLEGYQTNVAAFFGGDAQRDGSRRHEGMANEGEMREMERAIGVTDRSKVEFRQEIYQLATTWENRGLAFDYKTDSRLRAAVEARLFEPRRKLERDLTRPRFARQRVEWASRRSSMANRLVGSYDYCDVCAEDLIEYVTHILSNKPVLKTPKSEGVEWLWTLNPVSTGLVESSG